MSSGNLTAAFGTKHLHLHEGGIDGITKEKDRPAGAGKRVQTWSAGRKLGLQRNGEGVVGEGPEPVAHIITNLEKMITPMMYSTGR
jgi:hypothetical protein